MNLQTRFARLGAEEWQQIIEQQLESGLSQKDFCQSRQISLSTFSNWKRKLKQVDNTSPSNAEPVSDLNWIELPAGLPASPSQWHMELELPGGVVLRMRR